MINLKIPSFQDKNIQKNTIKIKESLLNIGLRKGLITKNGENFVFIGEYEELIAFKNNKKSSGFEILE